MLEAEKVPWEHIHHMLAVLSMFLIKHLPLASVAGRTLGARILLGNPIQLLDMYVLCCYENNIYNIIFFLLNLNETKRP